MMKFKTLKILSICATALLLASCGGKITASIGGTVSGPGLSTSNSMVLQNNGGDNLTVTGKSFTFAKQLEAGTAYNVTILTPPVGQSCFVENGLGVVEQSIGNVNSIVIVCTELTTASDDVLGTVTGLFTGHSVNLTNNGIDPITVNGSNTGNVNFVFPAPLATGAAYNVQVSGPTGTSCKAKINTNTGIIPSTGTIPLVTISC
jgi:hypothetical protein